MNNTMYHIYFKDQRGNQLYLGVNHTGIVSFQGSKKMNHFSWSQVQKINFEGKMFIIHIILNEVFSTFLLLNFIH